MEETNKPDALAAVVERNDFYRDSYRKVLFCLLLAIIVIIALMGSVLYIILNPPEPRYFATYSNGSLVPMIALDKPNVTPSALLQWANTAVIAVNTYDFVTYREKLQKASEYFTPDGWQAYLNGLESSRNLVAVIDKKLVVSAVATGAPVIIREGVVDGVYAWTIQMPILITYQSASQYSQQSLVVTLLVKRVPTLTNPFGVGISSYVGMAGSKL